MLRNRDVFWLTDNLAAIEVADPTKFGQKYAAVGFVQLKPLRKPETVTVSLLFEFWKSRALFKKILIGAVEKQKTLLKNL